MKLRWLLLSCGAALNITGWIPASETSADVLVSWGLAGGDYSIVTNGSRNLSDAARSMSLNDSVTMNPAIGPDYYPNSSENSPWFTGALGSPSASDVQAFQGLIVTNSVAGGNGNSIRLTKQDTYGTNLVGLCLWKQTGDGSRYGFLNGWDQGSVTLATNQAFTIVFRTTTGSWMTNELRYVIQKGTNYYVSSPVEAGNNWGTTPRTNSVDNPGTLVWHNYSPTQNIHSIGTITSLSDFSQIAGVGFRLYGERDTSGSGFDVRFFEARSMPIPGIHDPTIQARVISKNASEDQSAEDIAAALPFTYPPVYRPVGDGVRLHVPTGLSGQSRKAMGILDVTQPPFHADPSGVTDSTRSIQDAANFARDHQMIVFFPAGTYSVTNTLLLRQNLAIRDNARMGSANRSPFVLVGTATNPAHRAKICLAPYSPGFQDENDRKMVVHITNRTNARLKYGVDYPQANINYSHVFSYIDIEIGEGNPGAVGIRMQGAEGSCIQNVTIDATHGLAGMQGASGSGGSHHHITIIGGKIGIDTRGFPPEFSLATSGTQPTPTMSYVTLLHQTQTALINYSRGPLIGVGWRIVTSGPGPLIQLADTANSGPLNNTLALIDSEIVFETMSETNTVVASLLNRSFYFKDVYVSNGTHIISGYAGQNSGWLHVKDFAYPVNPSLYLSLHQFDMAPYVNGIRLSAPFCRSVPNEAPPADLRLQHIWSEPFPSWETPGASNVKDYGAGGDGHTDDTAAIQQAINENDIVFLPKGYFRVSDTLQLRPNTKLVGVAKHLSVILARGDDNAFSNYFGPIHDPANPRPLVATANNTEAETVLANVGILLTFHTSTNSTDSALGTYALRWQAGHKSVFRNVEITPWRIIGFPSSPSPFTHLKELRLEHPLVVISGHGGGKWYTFYHHGAFTDHPDYRHILVDNTRQPLQFYHLHAQDNQVFAQCEFRNARHVSVYGVKTEYVDGDNEFDTRFLWIWNCDHIRLFGHGGIARPATGKEHYLVEDTPNYLISNMGDQVWKEPENSPTLYRFVSERFGGIETLNLPSLHRPIVLLRGDPFMSGYDTDNDGMPDDWEKANGFNPWYAGDAGQDTDADGLNNLQEYMAGTNPRDAASLLKIEKLTAASATGMVLQWSSVTNKWYAIRTSTNLLSGFDGWAVTNIPATPTMNTQTVIVDQVKSRYYRVTVEP